MKKQQSLKGIFVPQEMFYELKHGYPNYLERIAVQSEEVCDLTHHWMKNNLEAGCDHEPKMLVAMLDLWLFLGVLLYTHPMLDFEVAVNNVAEKLLNIDAIPNHPILVDLPGEKAIN